MATSRLGGEHVIEAGKAEELAFRYIHLLILALDLFPNFLECLGRNITKSVIDLAQDWNQRVSFRTMFFDRFADNGGEFAFNCGCNHQTSVSGISSLKIRQQWH